MGLNIQFAGPAIRTANVSGDSFAFEGFNPVSGIYSSGTYVPFAQMTAGNPPLLSVGSGVIAASGPASPLGSGVVISGNVASGQIGNNHVSSGAITSGRLGVTGTPDGSLFLRDNFTWAAIGSGSILSGAIQSGQIGSGVIQGFFGSTRHIASGTVGVWDFGSGAVIAGSVGSGAVQSGNVASGSLGRFHVGSGQLAGFELGSGAIVSGRVASGQIGFGHLADGSVQSGTLASGSISRFAIASGSLLGFELGSGAIISGRVASGQIGFGHLADASVQSGTMASGQISQFALASGAANSGHVASGVWDSISPTTTTGDLIVFSGTADIRLPVGAVAGSVLAVLGTSIVGWAAPPFNTPFATVTFLSGAGRLQWRFVTAELISGLKAVAFASGDGYTIVRAERGSGLRLPAIGVTVSGGVSGAAIDVVMKGHLTNAASGMIASGFHTFPLYVGSGGLIINRSGFMEGTSSGDPFLSGDAVQKIGQAISGGIWVDPGEPRSGYVTAAAQGIF